MTFNEQIHKSTKPLTGEQAVNLSASTAAVIVMQIRIYIILLTIIFALAFVWANLRLNSIEEQLAQINSQCSIIKGVE